MSLEVDLWGDILDDVSDEFGEGEAKGDLGTVVLGVERCDDLCQGGGLGRGGVGGLGHGGSRGCKAICGVHKVGNAGQQSDGCVGDSDVLRGVVLLGVRVVEKTQHPANGGEIKAVVVAQCGGNIPNEGALGVEPGVGGALGVGGDCCLDVSQRSIPLLLLVRGEGLDSSRNSHPGVDWACLLAVDSVVLVLVGGVGHLTENVEGPGRLLGAAVLVGVLLMMMATWAVRWLMLWWVLWYSGGAFGRFRRAKRR